MKSSVKGKLPLLLTQWWHSCLALGPILGIHLPSIFFQILVPTFFWVRILLNYSTGMPRKWQASPSSTVSAWAASNFILNIMICVCVCTCTHAYMWRRGSGVKGHVQIILIFSKFLSLKKNRNLKKKNRNGKKELVSSNVFHLRCRQLCTTYSQNFSSASLPLNAAE